MIKRFPETEEARKIKERMDSSSETVTCGKCGATNIYNPKYYQKDKCEKCGEWLYQYTKAKDAGDQTNDAHSEQNNQVKKWSDWGFLKTILIGVLVCFLFAFIRVAIGLDTFSFVVDNLQFLLVILIATRCKRHIVLKIVAFLLIPLLAYTLGALLLLFGIGFGAHSIPSMSY